MGFAYNLLIFPTVKEFWKSVRFWQSYRYQLVVHVLGHSVRYFDNKLWQSNSEYISKVFNMKPLQTVSQNSNTLNMSIT